MGIVLYIPPGGKAKDKKAIPTKFAFRHPKGDYHVSLKVSILSMVVGAYKDFLLC